jgi:hypothetical protein
MIQEAMSAPEETVAALRARAECAEAALAQAQLELDALRAPGHDATVLAHLVDTLRWDGAPYYLRLVLPLARAIRAVGGGVTGRAPAAPAPPRRSWVRHAAIRGYLLVRPVALPLLTRLHRALGGLLEHEGKPGRRGAGTVAASEDLLRSIEAAMLTLALHRRDG